MARAFIHREILTSAVVLAASVFLTGAARAAEASPWAGDERSAVRLIGASPVRDARGDVLRAGIQIRMQAGWKTYWRYPGDSGVPPRFDFSQSDNVRDVAVLWPAPQRFADGAGGHSIGYAGQVLLPLQVLPKDPAKPVTIRLSLDYAICEKLCVPVDAKASLPASRGRTSLDPALAAAEARVPKKASLAEEGPLRIVSVRRDPDKRDRVLVDVSAPRGALDVFAEGPTPDWALPLPEPVGEVADGVRRFAFALDGVPPGAKTEGATLRITAVAGTAAIEVAAPLDEPR
jgi:DsbC/DsbD-like thiol-disulfide interchange protein